MERDLKGQRPRLWDIADRVATNLKQHRHRQLDHFWSIHVGPMEHLGVWRDWHRNIDGAFIDIQRYTEFRKRAWTCRGVHRVTDPKSRGIRNRYLRGDVPIRKRSTIDV